MKEITFLNKNAAKWKQMEHFLENPHLLPHPDEFIDIYIRISNDLAYARTYYPGSKTEVYLNELAAEIHRKIYKTKKEERNRLTRFFLQEYPGEIYYARKYILYSFLIFLAGFLLGMLSSANEGNYARLILGDTYVNMSLNNIENGNPMQVYQETSPFLMFLMIAYNNIKVMIIIYLLGLALSLGTIVQIIKNSVMVGTFQYLFLAHNVLFASITTIWIHGTIEIFTIILSGGAGIMLGSSLLFPGSYPRRQSFRLGAGKSFKIIIGTIPFILIAAFLESYITRHTEWHPAYRISIIAGSLLLILSYFAFYPFWLKRKGKI